jgi:hypothetical protein
MAPGAGSPPIVRVLRADGTETSFLAYDQAFTGGVHVALGDVNGDGIPDIITGAGPGGGPHVKVFSGKDLSLLFSFFAYDPQFTGGVFVAAGDVNGDGRADIITGAGPGGGPHVKVFSGADLSVLASFFAYDPAFPGGVFVAAGDVNGDGRADIITGAGPGGGPHVKVFSGVNLSVLASFFAYDPAFPGGVYVGAGDVNGDGRDDIVTGAGPGGGPHVKVFSGADLSVLASFFAYDPHFAGGVRVGAVDVDSGGRAEIITGAGPGGGPHVRVIDWPGLSERTGLFAFDPAFSGGVFVASLASARVPLRFTSAAQTGFIVGSPGTFTVTTIGGLGPRRLTVAGNLPAGVTFTDRGDGTGILAGTPTVSSQPVRLTFTATPAVGTAVTQSFTLALLTPPSITSPNTVTFRVGRAQTFSFSTTGFPPPSINVIGTLPVGVGWIQPDFAPPQLIGTPQAGTAGTYPLTITATNGVGSPATQSFLLTVENGVTFTSAPTATFTVGAPSVFSVTTVAIPAVTSIQQSGPLPAGVAFVDNGDGTAALNGSPAPGANGTYPITFTASNGTPSSTQDFTLTVGAPAGAAPTITSANVVTFVFGSFNSFLITTTGSPAPATITLAGNLPPGDPDHLAFVTFTNWGDGTASISGAALQGVGTYPLTITASNGVGTATQAFTLLVVDSTGAPQFTSAPSATFVVGTPRTFNISATPASSISVTGALPPGVTVTGSGTAGPLLTGAPGAGSAGIYPLTLTATYNGASATQSFMLIVQ